jgi:predicted RNA-binding Zn ribbon-like protein
VILGNPRESGTDLAVALVNTWDTYDDPPEHLPDVARLRRFLGIIGRERAARTANERDLAQVKHLRGQLRRVFEATAAAEAATALNEILEDVSAVPRLEAADGDWKIRFGPGEEAIAAHLGATAAAALAEIVRAHGVSRFGTCSAPPCTGAFVDRTKNRSKRYCCELCADRAAQQHHRARRRSEPG